jgi:4-hydroxy-2-oxoheptanedioate aldolase
VVIDLQHGGAAESDLPGMTSAIRLAGATPVARVRHAHPADIGRALDLGCEGVIVPNDAPMFVKASFGFGFRS